MSEQTGRLAEWVERFAHHEVPVSRATSVAIAELAERQDEVDANFLGEVVSDDPLMTLKVLVHVAAVRSPRMVTDAETVIAALVVIGISPFFRTFQHLVAIEDVLAERPQALVGLRKVMSRSFRAARFALSFAVHRGDHDAAVIHLTALLHDFAEALLWVIAPDEASEIATRLASDSTLRSQAVQQQVLGIDLSSLEQALMIRWKLPELLIRMSDDAHADNAQVQCVSYAVRLARHSADGWDNAAIPDDITALSEMLSLSPLATRTLVMDIDS